MMNSFMVDIINNAWMTSMLILVIMVLRKVFSKMPKYVVCILWGIVGLKLIFPVAIESSFSLLPSRRVFDTTYNFSQTGIGSNGIGKVDVGVKAFQRAQENTSGIVNQQGFWELNGVSIIWAIGLSIMLFYMLMSYLIMRKKVSQSILIAKNVSICDEIGTPFVLGIIRPQIYLPSGFDKQKQEYVLSHEKMHIKRGDQLWKPIGFLILSIYWFHPLCWIAYMMFCKDIELACDEMVIRKKNSSWRADYCQALLDYSVKNRKYIVAPLGFGDVGVKERVKQIMKYKKTKMGLLVAIIVVCAGVVVCFGTEPKRMKEKLPDLVGKTDNTETEEVKEVSVKFEEENSEKESETVADSETKIAENNATDTKELANNSGEDNSTSLGESDYESPAEQENAPSENTKEDMVLLKVLVGNYIDEGLIKTINVEYYVDEALVYSVRIEDVDYHTEYDISVPKKLVDNGDLFEARYTVNDDKSTEWVKNYLSNPEDDYYTVNVISYDYDSGEFNSCVAG